MNSSQNLKMDSLKSQQRSALAAVVAVTEAIREAGSQGIPAGTLYACLMSKGCTLEAYERLERIILNTGLVHKSGDLLTWQGPEIAEGRS